MEALDLSTIPADVLAAGETLVEESGLLAVADAALDATSDTGVAAQIVGDIVDVLIDFEAFELGPLGTFMEAHDDDTTAWVADLVIRLAMDPDRRAARRTRRAERRIKAQTRWAERQERREARHLTHKATRKES